jgi:hypothetical protein
LTDWRAAPPILFLIFNRPDLTKRVFERIREAHPSQLFIAADGPRADRPGEEQLCAEARAMIEQIDWECDVETLLRDENLGCKRAVSSAITWFFEHVEEGIILEDDCVPDPTFFPFCEELLALYRHEQRVMIIGGNNFQDGIQRGRGSYYFSRIPHIWGWASWSRAWSRYDVTMSRWPSLRDSGWLHDIWRCKDVEAYWRQLFDATHAGEIDTWDYQLTFATWASDAFAALPSVNLVSNVGFGPDATHTRNSSGPHSNLPVKPIDFPLVQPISMRPDRVADRYAHQHHFGVNDQLVVTEAVQKIRTRAKRALRRAKHLVGRFKWA